MLRRVAESGGNVAEGQPATRRCDTECRAQGSVAAGDDCRVISRDTLTEPRRELINVAGRGDVQVGIQRAASQLNRAPNPIASRAAGSLVEEDGGADGRYGSAARISAACSSVPVM